MSNKSRNDRSRNLQAKKETVMKTRKTPAAGGGKTRLLTYGILVGVLAAALGSGALWMSGNAADTVAGQSPDTLSPEAAVVQIPAAQFDDGAARHFEYRHGEDTIRFFVLKSADGVIRAAFDACDVCWPAGKGYYQEGDNMVCRNCGRRFASNRINEVKGGCNPAPLQRSVEGENLVIRVSDIIEGKAYFNFSGKA